MPQAQATLTEVVHRPPSSFALVRSRWCLAALRNTVGWLASLSLSGVQRLLLRLGIHYKRGRLYVHSPDPDYDSKVAYIEQLKAQVRAGAAIDPERLVFLYHDEMSYYAHPTVGYSYGLAGEDDVLAFQAYAANRRRRIAACVDILSGRVLAWQRASFRRRTLARFFQYVVAAYPNAQAIYIVLDNWPVHFHPDVLAALPAHVHLVPLPTYAPWLNPVEKLWRKLRQEVLHLHDLADHWQLLQHHVHTWLAHLDSGSPALLHYLALP